MNERTTAADRCRGVLVGLAAGDRIGGPVRMAVRLAESLAETGRFDAADVLGRYLAWWREGAFDTGPVSARALELVAAGLAVEDATAQVHREFGGMTAGCNPAHRSPPLAMCAAVGDDGLAGCAMAEARLTHHDPLAGEVAARANMVCRALIRGAAWPDAVRSAGDFAAGEGPGSPGGYAPAVLRAALYFVGSSACFATALDRALAFAGPANYCPVLAGAVAGARWGASAVPPPALGHVEILSRVRAAAAALAATWPAHRPGTPARVSRHGVEVPGPAWESLDDLLRAIAGTAPPFDDPVAATSRRSDGDTPLHVAAVWGDVSAIDLLVRAGADPDAAGDMGCTPLHNAVGQGHVEAARTLLAAGASPHIRSEFGTTAEEYAVRLADPEMVALFRKG